MNTPDPIPAHNESSSPLSAPSTTGPLPQPDLPPRSHARPSPRTPVFLKVLITLGTVVAIAAVGTSCFFGVKLVRVESQLSALENTISERETQRQQAVAESEPVRAELSSIIAERNAHDWCSQMTKDNRRSLSTLADTYHSAPPSVTNRIDALCPTSTTIAHAQLFAPLHKIVNVTISSCSIVSETTALIEGDVSVTPAQSLSSFKQVDLDISTNIFNTDTDREPSASSIVTVDKVPLDGSSRSWSTQVELTDPSARLCNATLSAWWPAD